MKTSELTEMSDEQLQLTLNETTESLFRLRVQSQTERLDAPSELTRHRRLIARIKTIQRHRELQRELTVTARFVQKSDNTPMQGSEYRVRLFDKDVFVNDPLGEDALDQNGRSLIKCDLDDAKRQDSILAFLEKRPDLYVVLEKDGKEVFRSRTFKNVSGVPRKHRFSMGTFKV